MKGTASEADGSLPSLRQPGTDSFPTSDFPAPEPLPGPGVRAPLDSWSDSPPTSPVAAARPAPDDGIFLALPEIGASFLGFELLAELGRGTFGRVYLARQPDLAGRLVALKVSTEIVSEVRKLAQLQHTHIVPVYSLHRSGPLQAVCMPYFGAATLADILADLNRRGEPPASGRGMVAALDERRARALAGIGRLSALSGLLSPPPPGSRAPEPSLHLRRLEGMTHVQAVLLLGANLADGLAHAHERGIVHRDLKPANILLTDDGQPMLLDFNLADDTKQDRRTGRVGGTLPYMAPEHLAAYEGLPAPFGPPGTRAAADARSDVYALGVILFELLAGQHPFPGEGVAGIQGLIELRLRGRPQARKYNPAVSPAVEAILARCLAPDPARRYASAAQLREDIQLHLDDLPLKHAREASLAERVGKWLRRSPRLATFAAAAALAGLLVGMLGLSLAGRGRRIARLDALVGYSAFQEDLQAARLALAGLLPDDPGRGEGVSRARRALARYGALDGPGWLSHPAAEALPPAHREALAAEAGELLLLLAGASGPAEGARLNRLAESCFPAGRAPVAVLEQRARLREQAGDAAGAARLRAALCEREPTGPSDRFLLARELASRGRTVEAARELRRVVESEPGHFGAWLLLGGCDLDAGADAAPAFTACVALRPSAEAAWRHRGLAHLRQGRPALAEKDLTRALERRRTGAALLLRGLARQALGQPRAALDDLDAAESHGESSPRLLLARASVKAALGDKAGARRDREAGLAREPADEESWVARGSARLDSDPPGALADFVRALAINPRSAPAWRQRAHVLAERLGRAAEAAEALARLLEVRPGCRAARAERAALLARVGKREEARAELRLALAGGPDGETAYRAACVHALLGENRPALARLAQALAAGFGHDRLEEERDLASLRGQPAFAGLCRAARTIVHASREVP